MIRVTRKARYVPPFKVGDLVRNKEFGPDAIPRRVDAVGRDEPFVGYVMVSGMLGWHAATRFEKVPTNNK